MKLQNSPSSRFGRYLLLLQLALFPLQQSLAQNLSTGKLSAQEQIRKSDLDKFIDQGYKCILSAKEFDGENVIDAEGVFTDDEEKQIENAIEQTKNDKQVKILLVTKEGMTRSGTMADFGIALGNCLGIGLSKVDNGILIQLDIKDHKSFITTGYRSETVLTDAECSRICRLGRPFFKNNDIPGGINAILAGLKKTITVEETKELSGVEKEELARKAKESNELVLTIFLYILMGGMGVGAGAYIYNRKRKYDNLISKYNTQVNKFNAESKSLVEELEKLKEKLARVGAIDISSTPRAKESIDKCLKEAKKIWDEIGGTNEGYRELVQTTWGNFFKGELSSGKKLNGLTEDFDTLDKKEDKVSVEVQNLDTIEKNFINIQEALQNLVATKNAINGYTSWSKGLQGEGYVFNDNSKNIEAGVKDTLGLLTTLDNSPLFEQKCATLIPLQEGLDTLEGIKTTVTNLKDSFFTDKSKIESYYIKKVELQKYDQELETLKTLVPQNIIDKYTTIKNNLEKTTMSQEVSINSYNASYETKDVEKSHNYYENIVEQKQRVVNAIKEIEQYIRESKEKKEKVPNMIKECHSALSQAKRDLHVQYRSDLEALNTAINGLIVLLGANRCDRIDGCQKLESIRTKANEISTKSKKKYRQEEEERQARIREEEARQARIIADERRAEESRQEESSRSSNSGGGSFGGGGGGDSW